MAHSQDLPDSSSPQLFVWPPGSETKIHDHSTWGGFRCTVGCVLEERYERLDKCSQHNHAHLKKAWQKTWSTEDEVSTVLPYEGGIHRVGNPGESPAISLHIYGPRIAEIDGRDYDLSSDYVCDRRKPQGPANRNGADRVTLLPESAGPLRSDATTPGRQSLPELPGSRRGRRRAPERLRRELWAAGPSKDEVRSHQLLPHEPEHKARWARR